MENNFIQMAASADHTVTYTIGPIFKHKKIYRSELILNCSSLHSWTDYAHTKAKL